jgi:hypothetical protein
VEELTPIRVVSTRVEEGFWVAVVLGIEQDVNAHGSSYASVIEQVREQLEQILEFDAQLDVTVFGVDDEG